MGEEKTITDLAPTPDYRAYWAALLKRHKALIAAGCISPVGCVRVGGGAKKDDEAADDNA